MKPIRRFEIVDLSAEFPGRGATIYSIALDDDEETLFDRFVEENADQFPDEIDFLISRIETVARVGARSNFFKDKEGKLGTGDGIEALFDKPNSNLRMYCIKFGSTAIILGGGGYKSKAISAFQEDPKLTEENYLLRELSLQINRAIRDGEIWWEGNRLAGKLIFGEDDSEA